jgi:proline iminopeptidase
VTTIESNGLTLEYESLGDPANPPIVLIMGLGLQMIFWPDALCRMLVEHGLRVVRFDNRDAGGSTQLDHLGMPRVGLEALKYALHLPMKAPYRIDDMARDTVGLLDALRIERAACRRRLPGHAARCSRRRRSARISRAPCAA